MSLRKMSRNEAKNKTNQTLKHAHAFVATHFILRLRLFFFFCCIWTADGNRNINSNRQSKAWSGTFEGQLCVSWLVLICRKAKKKNKTDEYYPNWLYLYGHETIGLSVGAGNGHCPFRTLRTKITNELMYMKHEEANIYEKKKRNVNVNNFCIVIESSRCAMTI